jgi:hypothetical protein
LLETIGYVSIQIFSNKHEKGCKAISFDVWLGEASIYKGSGSRKREEEVGVMRN